LSTLLTGSNTDLVFFPLGTFFFNKCGAVVFGDLRSRCCGSPCNLSIVCVWLYPEMEWINKYVISSTTPNHIHSVELFFSWFMYTDDRPRDLNSCFAGVRTRV